jgi:acetyltransferase-like isoleucine patch superfamily enzyme
MPNNGGAKIIHMGTPESDTWYANTKRAMALTAAINRLTFNEPDEVRALFSELTGREVDERFRLVPPFYTDGGLNIRVGRRVFINQNCTLYDVAGISIGDGVMIGPNVSILTTSHPVEPSERRAYIIGKPITIEDNVWIAAGVTVLGGVTVGKNSVLAAGSVVTKDVSPNTLVGGNPATIIRSIGE